MCGSSAREPGGTRATAMRCWRFAAPSITAPSIGCSSVIDNACEKRKNHRMLLSMTLQDLTLLESLLAEYDPALMAFDPLQSFFGLEVDMNHATDTRRILDAVRTLCHAHRCPPLFIRHNGKTQRSKAMHAPLGSIDITANMRSVLSLYK